MRNIYIVLCGLVLLSVFSPVFAAVNTAKIDVVRNKETLAEADTAVIEEFLSDAFAEFVAKTDFSDIATLRATIVSKSTSTIESGQIQYGPRFIATAQKEISSTFQKINALGEGYHKTILTTNLLILVNDLANIEIAKAALDYLQNPNIIVRYWAVNSLSNDNIIKQLNYDSEENRQLAVEITKQLLALAQTEQSSDILIFLAKFASGVKQPAANDILTAIAQKRIDLYMGWKANDELIEESILQAFADRAKTDSDSARLMAKNFAILYSLVIQKYVVGEQSLSETSRTNLVSVITQSEKLLPSFIPDWQDALKRSLEKGGGGATLLATHDSLLGTSSVPGKLPTALGFDYGKNPDGTVKTAPPTLPKPAVEKPPVEKQPTAKPSTEKPSTAKPQTEKPQAENKTPKTPKTP